MLDDFFLQGNAKILFTFIAHKFLSTKCNASWLSSVCYHNGYNIRFVMRAPKEKVFFHKSKHIRADERVKENERLTAILFFTPFCASFTYKNLLFCKSSIHIQFISPSLAYTNAKTDMYYVHNINNHRAYKWK